MESYKNQVKNTNKKSISISGFCLILLTVLFGVGTARAATFTVTNTNDSGAGSLRQAISDANTAAGDDTINFSLSNCPCTITLTSGELSIANNGSLTINGLGANQLSVSGNNQSRVFSIQQGATAIISGITITGGNARDGGGIRNDGGALTLTNSTVSGNSARSGGGIYNGGTTTLTNSTVNSNSATVNGGGVYNNNGATTLTNSTVSGNSAYLGGGIFNNYGGTTTLTNSTVSGNSANFGGGIFNNYDTLTLTNSTVSSNSANFGGGIYNQYGQANAGNSIVADNTAPDGADFSGSVASQGYNLFETAPTGGGTVATDLIGVDPKLGPLQDNGGATFTQALLPGSPAIDAGNSTLTTDQRGFLRPVDLSNYPNAGNGSDIGAFEAQNPAPTTKEQCKNGGWMTFTSPRAFKNQGDCIQFVNTGK
jgi:hypothetical protein